MYSIETEAHLLTEMLQSFEKIETLTICSEDNPSQS